jgi:hypothetical protein
MSQEHAPARAAVDAIVVRDGLHLSVEDYERLVDVYAELQTELEPLRAPELRGVEPAVIFLASWRP